MKSIEYYKFYISEVEKNGKEEALKALLVKMSDEALSIMKRRHCKRPSAFDSVIKEMNDRWNALRKYNSEFVRDGFLVFWAELTRNKDENAGQ